MSARYPLSWVIKPPARLRAIADGWAKWLRPLWFLLFGLSVLAIIISTAYAIRASYWVQPVIQEYGLDFDVTTEGKLVVGTPPGQRPPVPVTAKVVAIDGKPVPADLDVAEFAERLDAAPGSNVRVSLRRPDGRAVELAQSRTELTVSTANERDRDLRIWTRLVTALLACTALLSCSLLLALRRPKDPVAMLLAFAFVGMAATIDPPLQLWLWTDRAIVLDLLGAVYFYLLLIALASFPDGIIVPRFLRWLIPLGIPLAIFVSITDVDEDVQGLVAVVSLLVVLVSQVIRFRREPEGIARQQIKWAGFGFAAGLLLVLGAVVLAAALGDDPSTYTPLMSLAVLVLFSTGMTAIPLGLLVALMRFRLWEADTVITRSAAYAVVTMLVGIVWAASADLAKLIIASIMGQQHEAGATAIGAIIAAGVFGPTQSAVLGWTRRRFGTPADKLSELPSQVKEWSLADSPQELGAHLLASVDAALHPATASLALETERGPEEIASLIGSEGPDRAAKLHLPLRIGDELIGTLTLGPRSDGNRYGRKEREALQDVAEPIARALRTAAKRHGREAGLQRTIEEMAARLAQLEQGPSPKPA